MKTFFSPVQKLLRHTLDQHMIETLRLVFAASAFLIIFIDPTEPDRYVTLTYTTLALYTVYSGVLLWLARRRTRLFTRLYSRLYPWTHWLDMAWYTVLIALSSGTNSLFFFGFLFPILTASFSWGYRKGMLTALSAAVTFTFVSVVTTPGEQGFPLNRFLLRATYLLVFGYMFAYWGGHEIKLRRRLTLLKDLTLRANSRLGVDHTISALLERLREYFEAETCLLVLNEPTSDGFKLYRANAGEPPSTRQPERLTTDLAEALLVFPNDLATIYDQAAEPALHYPALGQSGVKPPALAAQTASAALATLFDTAAFLSVPLHFYQQLSGRLYLTRSSRFEPADAEFLLQVVNHFMPVLDNIRLVDQLASNAAEVERQRIARDLHDSVIQPYIGLQMGLTGLLRKLPADEPAWQIEAQQLSELTTHGLAELRRYVTTLKESRESASGLVPAVERFATKFTNATGILVQVEAPAPFQVNDRLAAEAFQIVAEGLSNIRRHTLAKLARIKLGCAEQRFWLEIENERTVPDAPAEFLPRSISGRALALGGQAQVRTTSNSTVVAVEIPL